MPIPNRWSELRTLVAELRVQPFPVSFVPLGTASELFRRPSRELGNTICLELQRGPLSPFEHAAKRTIDVVFAAVALIALLPLLTIVAIGIKMDSPGPILFRQKRCGFNGRSFAIRKFRTMSVLEDGPSIVQARFGDRAVYSIGSMAAQDQYRRITPIAQRAGRQHVTGRTAPSRAGPRQ